MTQPSEPFTVIRVYNPLRHRLPAGVDLAEMRMVANPPNIARGPLTALIYITAQSFSASCRTDNYSFSCAADFVTSTFFIHHVVVPAEEQEKGIGRRLFEHFLSWVRLLGLKKIRLVASGGRPIPENGQWRPEQHPDPPEDVEQIGYYTWGRFGFQMLAPDDRLFESWHAYYQCWQEKFPAILKDSNDRRTWWLYGFSWRGIFPADPRGESAIHFEEYVTEKTTRSGAGPA